MSNIVIFGASGQLGQCFKSIATNKGLSSIYFPSETEANILDINAIKNVFEKYNPTYCINCAAYTAVDKAEDEFEIAHKINKTGVENLSRLCADFGSILIHVSTDFVFEGNKSTPLTETDETNPVSVYGETKLEGEKVMSVLLNKYFIIRTGWLYSENGNNFVKTMLKLGAEKDELKIISDQIGTPTYAIDLATVILKIIESNSTVYGIYHYSNEGVASWYDFAKAIFDISNTRVKVIPVTTENYITRAVRPAYSVMDKSKIKKQFEIEIPYWRDSLMLCVENLNLISKNK